MSAATRAALCAALLVTGCVAEELDVLASGPVVRSCAEVGAPPAAGAACDFAGVCTVPAMDPGGVPCCTDLAVCTEQRLTVERYCPPTCTSSCMDDTGCTAGRTLCEDGQCVACPDPATCPPCPPGTQPLARNGCATCTCAPASQCEPADGVCATGERCYPGLVCADGCDARTPGCCANVCAGAGCPSPAPLGCRMECPPELGCTSCMATACGCDMSGRWSCTPVCSTAVGPCFQP